MFKADFLIRNLLLNKLIQCQQYIDKTLPLDEDLQEIAKHIIIYNNVLSEDGLLEILKFLIKNSMSPTRELIVLLEEITTHDKIVHYLKTMPFHCYYCGFDQDVDLIIDTNCFCSFFCYQRYISYQHNIDITRCHICKTSTNSTKFRRNKYGYLINYCDSCY